MKTLRTIRVPVIFLAAGIGAAAWAFLWQGDGKAPAVVFPPPAGSTAQAPAKSPGERVDPSFTAPLDAPVLPPAELPLPPGAINVTAPEPVTISNPPAQSPPLSTK